MPTIPITTDEANVTIDLGQIQFNRSITPGAVPVPLNVAEGALAINMVDRKIYTKDHLGAIITLGRDYTADIEAARLSAIATSNAHTDAEVATLQGGALDATLNNLLKLGDRLKTAEADIVTSSNTVGALTKADIGLGNVQDFGISDSVVEANSSQYASSFAVKTANDRAISGEAAAIAHADQIKADLLGGAPALALDTLVELGTALTTNTDALAVITTNIATKESIVNVNAGLALKVDIASISDSIISVSTTNVASSKAVSDAVAAAAASSTAGLALKVNLSDVSDLTDSQLAGKVGSSKAVADAKAQAIAHANTLVSGLAANLDYGVTF